MGDKQTWLDEFQRRAETEFPHAMKVGRYVFFLCLSFSLSILVAVFAVMIGAPKNFAGSLSFPVMVVAFLALRDMSRLWDMARIAARHASQSHSQTERGEA